MSNMASVSRPPSVHAPWRKSFIVPLFTIQLGFAAFVAIWHLMLLNLRLNSPLSRGFSIYEGTDSGMNSYTERVYASVGSFGVISTFVIILHIVLFAHFRLTAWIFLLGNAAVTVLSLISLVIGITSEKQAYGSHDYLVVTFPAVLCFISLGMGVYAVVVWRKVNSGMTVDMVKARGGFGGGGKGGKGGKGVDVQEDANAIPMV